MQGQSSPVQVKDSYTVSIPMHVGLSRKYTGVQSRPPKNNQKLFDGNNKKTKQNRGGTVQWHDKYILLERKTSCLINNYFKYFKFTLPCLF